MRNRTVSISFGAWLVLGTLPALAQPSASQAAPVATVNPSTTEHDSYIQKTRNEMVVWRDRLEAFGTDTKNTVATGGSDADRDLHSAWVDVQSASLRLQGVGADGWTAAKADYETASDRLAGVWHRVHPEKT